jgi:Peptidase A4 family.
MKASNGFNRTRFFSIVRVATAATLISAAAVMAVILGSEALVTVHSPPSLAGQNLPFVGASPSKEAAPPSEASLLGDLARQKRFLPASVKAAPNLNCKLHSAGREPGSGITVYTDADGYARFHAVRGGKGQTELLTCTDEAGHTSSYHVDLSSAATFADRPRDLAKELGTDRPPLRGDPSSYTQGQLAQMGYGLRPDRHSPAYASWLAAATKPGRILYTKRLSDLHHTVTPVTGGSWIGSVMTGAAPYDTIITTFQVPTAIPGAEGTTVTAATIWPGLGGFNTGSGLIQAGVVIQTTSTTASYATWREYCCGDPDSNGYAGAFVPSPGDKILAEAWYCDANGQVNLNGGFGCSYLYDFQSGAVFSCTTPRGNGSNPPCWSVKALPLCSVSPTAPNCMTLGASAEVIVENESGQMSPPTDQFPGFTPPLAMGGLANSVSKKGVTVSNDPAVFLLRDYPHGPPHVLVSLGLLGDTVFDEHPFLPAIDSRSFNSRRNLLQGDWGAVGNFELLSPSGSLVRQYFRNNDDPTLPWRHLRDFGYPTPRGQIGRSPRSVTFIQSTFKGDGVHGNFDAVVRVAPPIAVNPDVLDFWFLDSKTSQWNGPFGLIADGQQVSNVTGDPALIQSDWGTVGNYELLVPQGNVIGQYFRDNDDQLFRWHHLRDFGYPANRFPRAVTFIQSTFKGDGVHGNFDAVVRVAEAGKPDVLDFWFLDSKTSQWNGPFPLIANAEQVSNVSGDPVMIQGTWGGHGNYELLVPQGNVIGQYYRDNDDQLFRWYHLPGFGYPANRFPRSVTFIQSNFKGDFFHGNFDAVVRVAEAGKPDVLDFWFFDTQTGRWIGPFGLSADGQQVVNVTGD